jgi:hypothetical protein
MKIIQFILLHAETAEELKQRILHQANTWAGFNYLREDDPDYSTDPFDMDEWHEHLETPGLYWAHYGKIYAHLGDRGREVADQMFGTDGPLQGILLHAPLSLDYPDARLQIVEVDDPVAEGYLAAPVDIVEP